MAAVIAPRPFMVERGHDDTVGMDEWVAFEYANASSEHPEVVARMAPKLESIVTGTGIRP